MTASVSADKLTLRRRGIARWAFQMSAMLLLFGSLLFLTAGTMRWPVGWAFLALNLLTQALSAAVLIPRQGDMLAERSQVREGTKSWDRVLAPAIVLGCTLATLVTAGLDKRLAWSAPFDGRLWIAGIIIAFASQMFVLWAMASNPFFAATVRIQNDRGHTVVRRGPYRLVRHPGYAGSLVYSLALPLALCSWWTYVPALLTIGLTFIRTRLEDRTLQAELPGYAEYAGQVRFRLIPGVW